MDAYILLMSTVPTVDNPEPEPHYAFQTSEPPTEQPYRLGFSKGTLDPTFIAQVLTGQVDQMGAEAQQVLREAYERGEVQ